MKAAVLGLVLGAAMSTLVAAPVPVRFPEGSLHGFISLRSIDGALVAEGDLLQVIRDGDVEKRMVFRFKDGSLLEESVAFSQKTVYTLLSYHLLQRGPIFPEDLEVSLERRTGKYRVKSTPRNGGGQKAAEGTLELPPPTSTTAFCSASRRTSPRGRPRRSITWRSPPSPGSSSWPCRRPASRRSWWAISPRPPSITS